MLNFVKSWKPTPPTHNKKLALGNIEIKHMSPQVSLDKHLSTDLIDSFCIIDKNTLSEISAKALYKKAIPLVCETNSMNMKQPNTRNHLNFIQTEKVD